MRLLAANQAEQKKRGQTRHQKKAITHIAPSAAQAFPEVQIEPPREQINRHQKQEEPEGSGMIEHVANASGGLLPQDLVTIGISAQNDGGQQPAQDNRQANRQRNPHTPKQQAALWPGIFAPQRKRDQAGAIWNRMTGPLASTPTPIATPTKSHARSVPCRTPCQIPISPVRDAVVNRASNIVRLVYMV